MCRYDTESLGGLEMGGYASNEYMKSKKWISKKLQEGFDWESVKHFCVTPDKEYDRKAKRSF